MPLCCFIYYIKKKRGGVDLSPEKQDRPYTSHTAEVLRKTLPASPPSEPSQGTANPIAGRKTDCGADC